MSKLFSVTQLLGSTLRLVELVEPLDYVHEASRRVRAEMEAPSSVELRASQKTFASWFSDRGYCSGNQPEYDLVLASHVVYYLEKGDLDRLISCLSDMGRLLIVTDPLDSLFSACWRDTAPAAYRALQVYYEWCEHQTISYRERVPINIQCKEADSCVEALLPILTLCQNSEIGQNEREKVRSEIISRRDGQHVSTPVEIIEFIGE